MPAFIQKAVKNVTLVASQFIVNEKNIQCVIASNPPIMIGRQCYTAAFYLLGLRHTILEAAVFFFYKDIVLLEPTDYTDKTLMVNSLLSNI